MNKNNSYKQQKNISPLLTKFQFKKYQYDGCIYFIIALQDSFDFKLSAYNRKGMLFRLTNDGLRYLETNLPRSDISISIEAQKQIRNNQNIYKLLTTKPMASLIIPVLPNENSTAKITDSQLVIQSLLELINAVSTAFEEQYRDSLTLLKVFFINGYYYAYHTAINRNQNYQKAAFNSWLAFEPYCLWNDKLNKYQILGITIPKIKPEMLYISHVHFCQMLFDLQDATQQLLKSQQIQSTVKSQCVTFYDTILKQLIVASLCNIQRIKPIQRMLITYFTLTIKENTDKQSFQVGFKNNDMYFYENHQPISRVNDKKQIMPNILAIKEYLDKILKSLNYSSIKQFPNYFTKE